jgi:hypothetical protein
MTKKRRRLLRNDKKATHRFLRNDKQKIVKCLDKCDFTGARKTWRTVLGEIHDGRLKDFTTHGKNDYITHCMMLNIATYGAT